MTVLDTESLALRITTLVCTAVLIPGDLTAYAQPETTPSAPIRAASLTPEALDSLVTPIALYPDQLLAQVLAASTYPLDIVEANQWLKNNSSLQGQARVQAAAKQDWEPCIQVLVLFPSVVDQLDANLKWTTALGNAFLAQQSDVMDAVQRMRKKAEGTGALKTNEQQKVETKVIEQKKGIEVSGVPEAECTA